MASLAHNVQNDTRLRDLEADIRALGRESVNDARPKFALRIVKAAADGVIDLSGKDADGKDEAYRLFKLYADAHSGKAMFDRTTNAVKKGASELRTLINLGLMSTVDGVKVIETAASIITSEGNPEARKKRFKDAFNAFLAVARKQLESPDSELTEAQITESVERDAPEARGQKAYLKAAAKALENALKAEDADGSLAERIGLLGEGTNALLAYLENAEKRRELQRQLDLLAA